MVSQKLYHRRCFRCSKCMGHLNPKNYHVIDSNNFSCDSCKNEKSLPKFNNNNQIGMLAFNSDMSSGPSIQNEQPIEQKVKSRPQSILGENQLSTLLFTTLLYFILHVPSKYLYKCFMCYIIDL